MTSHDENLDRVLRPWMQRHAPDAPNTLVLRIIEEIQTMSEQAPSRGWLSRFTSWPAAAWAATVTAIAILAVAGGILVSNLSTAPAVGTAATPTPLASPAPSDPTAIVDGLLAAWNAGDGQDAVSRYVSVTPIVRFMIDSGDITERLSTDAQVQAAVVAWAADGSVMNRTGAIARQGAIAAFPMTWTSSTGSVNAVCIVRIDPGTGLVLEQYVIGATSRAVALLWRSAAPASADLVNLVDKDIAAINATDAAAASALFATDAEWRTMRNGEAGTADLGRSAIAKDYGVWSPGWTWSRTGAPIVQGPFVFYPETVIGPGEGNDGFGVLELDADGLIRYAWDIGAVNNQLLGSAAPSPGGG